VLNEVKMKSKITPVLTKHHAMNTYGGGGYLDPHFLTSALVRGEWSASRHFRFTSGERDPGNLWIGGRVDPNSGLNNVEKRKFLTLTGLELRPLGRPARGQSLNRLRYPGSKRSVVEEVKNFKHS
jgi:hypothetical protein